MDFLYIFGILSDRVQSCIWISSVFPYLCESITLKLLSIGIHGRWDRALRSFPRSCPGVKGDDERRQEASSMALSALAIEPDTLFHVKPLKHSEA